MDNVTNTLITQPDSFGRQWIYVTDSQVYDHPKGHFGVFIWIICLWFACVGGLEIVLGSISSMPRLIYGVLVFITSAGLVLRNRLA